VDRRLLPGEDPEAALADIEAAAMAVDGLADPVSGKKWRVEVKMGPFMYPSLLAADSPIVALINRAGEAMLGSAPETCYAPNAFDQGYLNHVGIPTANYGAGEQRFAHTDNDMASVERTFDSAKVYAYMIADYLG
jgi:acetylornithine deacetylase/succinyl-diaminopimelate desuccinylase-like protein